MSAWRRHWPAALAAAMLVLGVAAEINILHAVGRPFVGVVVYRNHLKNLWQVEPSTPPWWPVLTSGRLQYDDVLVALDGVPYGVGSGEQLEAAARTGRPFLPAVLLRHGRRVTTDVPIVRFTLGHFIDMMLPDFINGLGLWFLAVAVLRARPGETLNRVFAATFGLAAGGVWATTPALFIDSGAVTRLLQLVWVPAFCGIGSPFVHLTLLVPEPVRRIPRRLLVGLYAYAGAISAAYMAGMVLWWRDPSSPFAIGLTAAANGIHHVFLISACLFCGARLVWFVSRRDLSRRLGRQVAVLSVGLSLCIPYIVIKLLRSLAVHGHFWNGLDLRCTLLPLPISIAFLILRYQTFRKAHPAIGGVLILGTSAFMASVGAWMLRLADPGWMASLTLSPFLPLFSVAFVASLLWSTETSWRESFARLFDWHRRSYAAVRQFGQEVVSQDDLRQMPSAIVSALVGRMELERVALWLCDEKGGLFALAAQAGVWRRAPVAVLRPDSAPPYGPVRLAGANLTWLMPLRGPDVLEVAVVLWASGRPVGLLALGKRWDEEIFDERDLEIVELIAQQAALFLLTAAQIDQLRRVPQKIAETQERERFKIAQELHDTVQQFLGRLPFYLEVSRNAARDDPGETETILDRCMADVATAAQTVREIRANLAPLQLERSLTLPLRRLVTHFTTRSGIASEVAIADGVDEALGLEARHALYRVVQQALDNVVAHAEAAGVTVTVSGDGGRVQFAITDDGRGFSDEQRQRAVERGSFGLTSMRARVVTLGGELQVESWRGAGTRVSGWLPYDDDGEPVAPPEEAAEIGR